MPAQNGTMPARDRPGQPAHAVTVNGQEPGREQQRPERHDPGLEAVVEDRHLERSARAPAPARATAISRATLAPSEVPPTTACSAPRWSSSATTCSAKAVME